MSIVTHQPINRTRSFPNVMLHIEGIAVAATVLFAYHLQGFSWLTFLLLVLMPDVSMVGYLFNKRIGSHLYNAAHSYTLPLLLGIIAYTLDNSSLTLAALIWLAHIGLDRAVGYGLKYQTDFKDTHLSRV